ncbi:hypothetical protein [Rhizohabitans arisaemae]|uniref:hypothetical protein n=1 Tax=Rhizohabitans arisaemae TaxID=2720610 RepID=UPI0024B13F08|nr:hypothetical protein [Rhizohabitans arisaemae]
MADAGKPTERSAADIVHAERQSDRVREGMLKQRRAERIEPPASARDGALGALSRSSLG